MVSSKAVADLDYTWLPARAFRRHSDPNHTRKIRAIILHSGDGHEQGDIETLTRGAVSAHWYVNRAGRIWHMVADSDVAFHAGVVAPGMPGNEDSLGIEQEHIDGKQNWPAAQVRAVAKLVVALRQKHGHLDVLGHAAVAYPKGRKRDPRSFPWAQFSRFVGQYESTTWNLHPV